MKHMLGYLLVAAAVMACGMGQATAAFEPLFQTVNVQGKCTVQTPDDKGAVDAEENKAYPYGSQIKTDKAASLTVRFGADNSCGIGEAAAVTVGEQADDPSKKVLGLDAGKLDLTLADGFQDANGMRVNTICTEIDVLKGPKCSVEAVTEGDLNVAVVMAQNGSVAIKGPEFKLGMLDGEDALSVACSMDQTFVRVKNVKGEFDVEVTDAEGNPRTVAMTEGSTIKIWQKASEGADEIVVTLLVSAADGTLLEAINYRKSMSGAVAQAKGTEETAAEEAAGEEGEAAAEGEGEGDLAPVEGVTTPAATTTLDAGLEVEEPPAAPTGGRPAPGPDRPTPTHIGFGRD
jgi:ribosomal protein L12E/L44/L45/RPP1/RPP2